MLFELKPFYSPKLSCKSGFMGVVFSLLLTTFSSVFAAPPGVQFEFAVKFGTTVLDKGIDIEVDNDGNIYTLGRYTGTVDFDPGPGVYELTAIDNVTVNGAEMDDDIFLVKLTSTGQFVYATSTNTTPSISRGNHVATDSTGNAYISGHFQGTVDFDPGPGVYELTSTPDVENLYIQKLDPAGNLLFVYAFNTLFSSTSNNIVIDDEDTIFYYAQISGLTDMDPSEEVTELGIESGGYRSVLVKYSSSGTFLSAITLPVTTSVTSMIYEKGQGIYIAGSFNGTTDFDPSAEEFMLDSSVSGKLFAMRFDTNLNFSHAIAVGNQDYYQGISGIDVNQRGEIYIIGMYNGTVDFDPGPGQRLLTTTDGNADPFLLKLDKHWNLDYIRSTPMENISVTDVLPRAVVCDKRGFVHVSGHFKQTVDLDPSSTVQELINVGASDVYVQTFNSRGFLISVFAIQGGWNDYVQNMAVDRAGNSYVYLTGSFFWEPDFDPNPEVEATLVSDGNIDAYTAKYRIHFPNATHVNKSVAASETELTELGTQDEPFGAIEDGILSVESQGTVIITSGTYTFESNFDIPVRLDTTGGPVILNAPQNN